MADNKLSRKEKIPLNMFVLTVNNCEDIDNFNKITHILGCQVEIQPMRGSKLIPQCKKCQAFGHTQKCCAEEPRCVKCAGKHPTRECQKAETKIQNVSTVAKGIQPTLGEVLWPTNYRKSRKKNCEGETSQIHHQRR